MRVLRIGPALLPLLLAVACSNVQVIRMAPAADSGGLRAAVLACCREGGFEAYEEADLESDAVKGSYGDQIRSDPELLEIFPGEFEDVWLYKRQGRYELEIDPGSEVGGPGEAIRRCLDERGFAAE